MKELCGLKKKMQNCLIFIYYHMHRWMKVGKVRLTEEQRRQIKEWKRKYTREELCEIFFTEEELRELREKEKEKGKVIK